MRRATLTNLLRSGPPAAATALRGWRRFYGENPLHLLAMLGCFALAGYVVSVVFDDPGALALLLWFFGAVIGHDLVMYPLYALADQPLAFARRARRKVRAHRPPVVAAINHLRVPALGAGVLGLIYLPSITAHDDGAFGFTAGHPPADHDRNWLLITAVLFLGSALLYALRLGTAMRRTDATGPEPAPPETGEPDADGADRDAVPDAEPR